MTEARLRTSCLTVVNERALVIVRTCLLPLARTLQCARHAAPATQLICCGGNMTSFQTRLKLLFVLLLFSKNSKHVDRLLYVLC